MGSNKYAFVGWLAIVQAILFPLMFIIAIAERGIASGVFDIDRPFFGPSDILGLIFTLIAAYTLLMFKRLLNEHYNYNELNLLIYISIWWAIMFEIVGLGLGFITMVLWPVEEVVFIVIFLIFMAAAMVTIGIVDILIAIKLLKIKEKFGEYIRVFAYVTMAAGICEVSVLLVPFAVILVPVTAIVLALIFFKDKKDKYEVEYV